MAETTTHREIYSVSRLNSEIRAVLEGSFPLLWVQGEISNLATPRSGHAYFTLKDDHAQVRCALFRNRRRLLRFQPKDGDQVLLRARISLYETRGEFQLIVEQMEPAGEGALQRAFEELKRKLEAEGLFDARQKKTLPPFPRCLGIITSPTGAALRDILQVLRRRFPALPVIIYPTQVQGDGAAGEILQTLKLADARNECDLLILTRGGGSLEDLAAFNDEALARAIAAARTPVISAIGHEVDFTIADFVADRRAPTPSAAAELATPDQHHLLQRLSQLEQRLIQQTRRQLGLRQEHLSHIGHKLRLLHPERRLQHQQQKLDELSLRLEQAIRQELARKDQIRSRVHHRLLQQSPQQRLALLRNRVNSTRQRLEDLIMAKLGRESMALAGLSRTLNSVSPLQTLARGYSITTDPDTGKLIRGVEDTAEGRRIHTRLAAGSLISVVEKRSK